MPQSYGEIHNVSHETAFFLQPLGARLLVQPVDTPSERCGLIVPEVAKDNYPMQGMIVEAGPGCMRDEDDKVVWRQGDNVAYSRYAGSEFKFGDNRYLILNEEDILGLIHPNAKEVEKRFRESLEARKQAV